MSGPLILRSILTYVPRLSRLLSGEWGLGWEWCGASSWLAGGGRGGDRGRSQYQGWQDDQFGGKSWWGQRMDLPDYTDTEVTN
eukprot:1323272-Amorphochlora_amoeboformis.AAC.1